VPAYRLYFVDSHKHITRFCELECESDEAVEQEARRRLDGHAIEIWDRAREVIRLEPEGLVAAADVPPAERARLYCELAAEAEAFAATASPENREAFLAMASRWRGLAEELDRP
jgi:hypothetical protein